MEINAENPINLNIYTPQGSIVEAKVTNVKLPMADGEAGVLPGHIKYVGLLGTGVCTYQVAGSNTITKLIIVEGFCNLMDNTLNLQADEVILEDDIDKDTYAEARNSLKETISKGHCEDPERVFAYKELTIISAIDKLLAH